MEYVYYLLVVMSILSLLLIPYLRSGNLRKENIENVSRTRASKKANEGKHKSESVVSSPASHPVLANRQMSQVPTPWGWPGHQGQGNQFVQSGSGRSNHSGNPGVASDAFNQWVDRLMSEKRTVEDQAYVLRRDASLRALLEDRYGKSHGGREQPENDMKRSAGHTGSHLNREARQLPDKRGRSKLGRTSGLKDIRMPWGW